MRGPYFEADWRREQLRTNLWLVPILQTLAILVLFGITYTVDRAAYDGWFRLPNWVLNGSADSARVVLATVAAAIITVVGVVFSITIVALTLASTQFGPRMLRNFVRDRGTKSRWEHLSRRFATRWSRWFRWAAARTVISFRICRSR
jgi:uncharacterized membrane protein